jgi:chromosome segregation ATPase
VTRILVSVRRRLRRRLRRAGGYDELVARVARTESVQARQAEKIARLQERVARTRERLDEIRLTAYRAHTSYEILGAQVGSMEERLQDLAESLETRSGGADSAIGADDEDTAVARGLVAEIRDEHRRIRVRFGTMTQYEERIRRLESALSEEMAAAAELAHQAAQHGVLADAPTHGAVDLPDD